MEKGEYNEQAFETRVETIRLLRGLVGKLEDDMFALANCVVTSKLANATPAGVTHKEYLGTGSYHWEIDAYFPDEDDRHKAIRRRFRFSEPVPGEASVRVVE